MKTLILLSFLLVSCGKVKVEHKMSLPKDPVKAEIDIPTEFNHATTIGIKKMYEEWLAICLDNYPIESIEYAECKEKAVDGILDIVNNVNNNLETPSN